MLCIWVICTAVLIAQCPKPAVCENLKPIFNVPVDTLVSTGNSTLIENAIHLSGLATPEASMPMQKSIHRAMENRIVHMQKTSRSSDPDSFSSLIDLPAQRAGMRNQESDEEASEFLGTLYGTEEQGGEFYPPSASRQIEDMAQVAFITPFGREDRKIPHYSSLHYSNENMLTPGYQQGEFSAYLKAAVRSSATDFDSTNPWLKVMDFYDWKDADQTQNAGDAQFPVSQEKLVVPECRMDAFDLANKVFVGKGGQATAYLVHLKSNSSTRFIIKSYSRPVEFEREIRTVNFPHPSIIKIGCAVRERLSVIMPYADGGDLWKGFPRSKSELSDDLVVQFAAQLVTAIERIHAAGYLHHDVKPHNLVRFLNKNRVALIDFGLSVPISGAGYRRGTKITMAPEVATVAGYEDAPLHEALDWWSAGVTIYMLHKAIHDGPIVHVGDDIDKRDENLLAENFSTMNGLFTSKASERVRKLPIFTYLPYKLVLPISRKRTPRFSGRLIWNPIPDSFSPELRSLLKRLMHPDPEKRRFNTPSQIGRLKAHPYFAKVNWRHLY